MDINLNTLKREIEEYLETAGFAVFRGSPGGLEEFPMVLWDSEQYPDYQMFLDTAKKAGAAMVVFATREFESAEIEEALEQIEECDMERGERRELERRLREMRSLRGQYVLARIGLRPPGPHVRLRSHAGLVRRIPGHRGGDCLPPALR